MATIKDVAQRAGVSVASVSRALNGHPSTSPEMHEKVLAAARALNFRPNAVARSLRTTGTRTIGLIVSDLLNPYFAELARAVEDAARRAGYSVIVGNADEDPAQQDHYVRHLLEQQVDGLLVVPTVETSPLLREAAAQRRHLVLLDRPAADVEAPLVLGDGSRAIDELVTHLVSTGRRDLGIITGPDHAGSSRERLEAFAAAIRRHGLELPGSRVYHGDFRRDSGAHAMTRILTSTAPPDAVLIANGNMALGALTSLTEHQGIHGNAQAPALAVFDDSPWFRILTPTITAITQPTATIGRRAVEILLAHITGLHPTGQPEPTTERVECHLALRESTAAPAGTPIAPRRTTSSDHSGRRHR